MVRNTKVSRAGIRNFCIHRQHLKELQLHLLCRGKKKFWDVCNLTVVGLGDRNEAPFFTNLCHSENSHCDKNVTFSFPLGKVKRMAAILSVLLGQLLYVRLSVFPKLW